MDDVAQLSDLEGIFGRVASVAIGLAGVVFFIMLLLGGFKYITAGDEPAKAETAKKTLTTAIIGLVFIALALLFLKVIESITGVTITEFTIRQ